MKKIEPRHDKTNKMASAPIDDSNEPTHGTNDDRSRLFDTYHLKTDDEVKDSIASSYQKEDGRVFYFF